MADAWVFLMESGDDGPLLKLGVGKDVTIATLARLVSNAAGFEGRLRFDTTKPDARGASCWTPPDWILWAGTPRYRSSAA